jgi:hypothetical protein
MTRYADATDYARVWADEWDERHDPLILGLLEMSAPAITAALAAVGATDCTMADWATEYLKHLNCVAAALFVKGAGCPFPSLTMEEVEFYGRWLEARLAEIRDGTIDLCEGGTGKAYPAIEWAEQSVTDFAAARITYNAMRRYSP